MSLSKKNLKYIERFANVIRVLHSLSQNKEIDLSGWDTCILGRCARTPWFIKRHFRYSDVSEQTLKFSGEYGWRAVSAFFNISDSNGLRLFMYDNEGKSDTLPSTIISNIYNYLIDRYGLEVVDIVDDFVGRFVTGRNDDQRRFFHQTYADAVAWIENIRLNFDPLGVSWGEYYIDAPEKFLAEV